MSHRVLPGESLSAIGERYGVPWREIWHANRALIGDNPNLVRPGWILVIPKVGRKRAHIVQAGETLSEIAAKYGTTADVLRDLNGLANLHLIHPGQQILLP
ncbi:LysM peptidoglycan-binding domain-containing protein [Longimycelium tulufanense]|uniref:LysM peptidoglycan-binding domain-containing protein n=1 Tax=Longimycelium tulufanense TaxID=907463 RepID=UPI001E5D6D39|nr:LysM domain-containing protein [Longimycelium tulufanense]